MFVTALLKPPRTRSHACQTGARAAVTGDMKVSALWRLTQLHRALAHQLLPSRRQEASRSFLSLPVSLISLSVYFVSPSDPSIILTQLETRNTNP
ncbi:hypothetical protein E2C01_060652 [Portunus trituberculatus]|uniref:Uncharacterized protein n=1 Tax=Portunus trituberculatus TaxID=210409 RepID=A0A5B7HCP6_PORTR|nr:hypothetical protein [Portunus trituberculatus]